MKRFKLLCSMLLLAGVAFSGNALADHRGHGGGHVGLGFYFGAPYYPYYPRPYYPDPYYAYPYYPPVVTVPVPTQPPVYIEQGNTNTQAAPQQAPAAQANNYWYHCDKPEGYYPYVKDCPGGWERVDPTPPPPQSNQPN